MGIAGKCSSEKREKMSLEDFVRDMPLVAIFYGRFDNQQGAIIEHDFPIGTLSKNFTSTLFRKLLIPRDELCGKVLTVKTHEEEENGNIIWYKIISCPESVKNERYDRNAFKFNFGF